MENGKDSKKDFSELSKKNGYGNKVGSPPRKVFSSKGVSKSKYNNVIKDNTDSILLKKHYIVQSKFTIDGRTFFKSLTPHREIIFILNDINDETVETSLIKDKDEGRVVDKSLIDFFFNKIKTYVDGIIFDTAKKITVIERNEDKTGYTEVTYIFNDRNKSTPAICRIIMKLSNILDNEVDSLNLINKAYDIINNETKNICENNIKDLLQSLNDFTQTLGRFVEIKNEIFEEAKNNIPDLQNEMNEMLNSEDEKIFKSKEYREVSDELKIRYNDLDLLYRACIDISSFKKKLKEITFRTQEQIDIFSPPEEEE